MNWSKTVGNLLIVGSLVALAYTYYPVILSEWRYRTLPADWQAENVDESFSIVIPKLGISEQVFENVDPFDRDRYLPVLEQGVAHASGSATPDQSGTTYLFAHSSDNPLAITRYNTAFYLLDRLKQGDLIKIYYQAQVHEYRVREVGVVRPSQVEFLTQATADQLILQTCTPIGTAINRLLVFADRVEP